MDGPFMQLLLRTRKLANQGRTELVAGTSFLRLANCIRHTCLIFRALRDMGGRLCIQPVGMQTIINAL